MLEAVDEFQYTVLYMQLYMSFAVPYVDVGVQVRFMNDSFVDLA
jgi:hypothetical protein